MASQHTSFILKVLNGINSGASVRLRTGSVVIGRSMTSDIILHDDNIADQHIQLLITPGSITLQPLARPVFVEAQEIAAESIELAPYQTVKLGNVEFLVADSRVSAPRTQAQKSPETNAKRATVAGTKSNNVPPPAKKSSAAKSSANKGMSGKTWLLLGVGLLLLANLIYWAPQFNRFLETLGLRDSGEQQAAGLLKTLGEQDFNLVNEADGSVSLRGYTDTVEERNAIMGKIQDAGIKANVYVWAQDEMANSANMIARAMGQPGISFKPGATEGILVAQGFVTKKADWERVKTTILNDIGGIRSIGEADFQSLDGYLASFVQFIEKKGLSSRITATTDGKSVIVNGELTQSEIQKLTGLRQEFIGIQGDGPAIVLNVTDIRDRITLAIRSVSVGKIPFLVAKDGKKYMEGSALGEKYFVKSIKSDHVVLTNNGMEIPFYYGIDKGRNDANSRTESQK
ncbi:type III secretion system inner membrane ring subunit SctD [Thiothrix subterranea]|uniref:type III secretion system inner membrane ring subunit SctD n=1 Tax=Thiothrix subterranea TaxID=2735563 RepID=UPI00192CA0E9|nr:type III secretion system inner membrane ring subunit SctD [Thiothrix subterranea]QQZ28240.1 type III secretion system inner membrane ring subunit SctD [Thiothrix subterranea]